ncbi:MAG: DUF499 domain-containing protein [Bacillota bacterium]
MALSAWWQVATPHKDIREGSFTEAVFAADLSDVMRGTAPEEYRDPQLFFGKTYLTAGLQNLCRNVLSRLTTGEGDPVIQLQTPFGGGKTHALLCLYHLVQSPSRVDHLEGVRALLEDFPLLAGARVAAFVGTAADPIQGRTPWGEIAHQLGCYEVVREHDVRRVAPGKERLQEMLARSGPTLILIDELLEYIVKASRVEKVERITQGQTVAFLQELSEAVASSKTCALVLTLPASILEQYDEEAEKALSKLQKVAGRVESIYVPVEGMEIYEVIRTRLFADLGDRKIHRQVAESYFRLYQGLGSDVPAEVREPAYREKIERAYPFHPELIDVLYERWGSFPTFQRTRGVLRLLAQVVAGLYKRVPAPLIQSALADLADPSLRREFIKHIGNEYDSIIAADVTGKARQIDREMGSEYEKHGIAAGLATAVFLYSFSGGERRGVTLPWLRVALLREGVPPTIVGDAVGKLEDSLWYFHTEKRLYSFKNQPNLNRVIVDKEETIEPAQIPEALKEHLTGLTKGAAFDVCLWPRSPADVPDSRRLKLVLLEPDLKYGDQEADRLARELVQNAGSTFRVYRNTVFILALDAATYQGLEKQFRRYLALRDIAGDAGIALTAAAREEVQNRLKQAEKDLPFVILAAYRHLAWYGHGGAVWRDMGLPTVGQKPSLALRAWQYLKEEERLLSSLTPKLVLDRAFGREETEKSLQEIYDVFLKTPGLPCLEGERVLVEAVRQGAASGLLGVRLADTLYLRRTPPDLSMEAVVLRPENAEEEERAGTQARAGSEQVAAGGERPTRADGHTYPEKPLGGPGVIQDGGQQAAPVIGGRQAEGAATVVKRVAIRAAVPWDKLSQIVGGVIGPLKAQGAEPEITIEIRAETKGGFDRTTLDSKVKETLLQLGANIAEWKEE